MGTTNTYGKVAIPLICDFCPYFRKFVVAPIISHVTVSYTNMVQFFACTEEQDSMLHIILLLCFLLDNEQRYNEINQHKYANVIIGER